MIFTDPLSMMSAVMHAQRDEVLLCTRDGMTFNYAVGCVRVTPATHLRLATTSWTRMQVIPLAEATGWCGVCGREFPRHLTLHPV